ncbi:hypothetical protein LCGC14_3014350, partial [marine sediment metagenome]
MNQVRLAAIAGFNELVRELNGDPAAVLLKAGLSPTFFADHNDDDMMGYEKAEDLLQTAADATQCSYFGALLGTKQDIHLLGIIGYVMQQSTDVRTALNELCQHFSLHVKDAATISIDIVGDYASFAYTTLCPMKSSQQSSELAIAESMIVLKAVCGAGWKPYAVNFTHKAPENITPYAKIFKVPVNFSQDQTQILFPKTYLSQPILQADPVLNKILQNHIGQLKSDAKQDLCSQVETLIRRTLPTASCSIENIASLMAVHRRTLHRMLKEQGSSFTELLEKVRKSIAAERLQNSDITIIQLSDYLGYADNT